MRFLIKYHSETLTNILFNDIPGAEDEHIIIWNDVNYFGPGGQFFFR